MHDDGERVADLAVQENVEADELAPFIPDEFVVKTCVPLGARLEFVEEVVDDLVEGKAVLELDAVRVEVGHVLKDAALVLAELHDGAEIVGRGVDLRLDDGLLHVLDFGDRRQVRGVVHEELGAVRLVHAVGDGGRRRDDVEVELALDALLNDLHVEKPQKAAAEAEAERDGVVGLEGQGRVVELEL